MASSKEAVRRKLTKMQRELHRWRVNPEMCRRLVNDLIAEARLAGLVGDAPEPSAVLVGVPVVVAMPLRFAHPVGISVRKVPL